MIWILAVMVLLPVLAAILFLAVDVVSFLAYDEGES